VVRDPESVREVLHRPADFSPANALVAVTPLEGPALRVLQRVGFALPPVLASNDTGTHGGIRKVVAGFFTPATVAAMEPRIRELAREAAGKTANQLARSGHADLVQAVAAFPPAVIMFELLGLPMRDLAELKRWGLDSMELFWGWPDADRQLELARSAAEFYVWLRRLDCRIRGRPGTQPVQVAGRTWPDQDRDVFARLLPADCRPGNHHPADQHHAVPAAGGCRTRGLEGSRLGSRRPISCPACARHRIIRPHLAPPGSP
jgi:cytochrome P450